jgi:hypothetical protein
MIQITFAGQLISLRKLGANYHWNWRMPSSGLWRSVDLVWIDVSEERIASIFRVDKSAIEEPAWAGGCRLSHQSKTPSYIRKRMEGGWAAWDINRKERDRACRDGWAGSREPARAGIWSLSGGSRATERALTPLKMILYRLWPALCYLLTHLYRPYPSPFYWYPMRPTLPPSLFLYSWVFSTGGSVCSHLLTLVPRSRICLPWRWRQYVPPKRRFTQDIAPHPRRRHSS